MPDTNRHSVEDIAGSACDNDHNTVGANTTSRLSM